MIYTPDQDKTDFYKSLEIILDKGGKCVHVYGASGKEQDHFLGNLNTAYLFKEKLDIVFFDDYSSYFFIPKKSVFYDVKGKVLSLIPFPYADDIFTNGLYWELKGQSLSITGKMSVRNRAYSDKVDIEYKSGALILFVEKSKG